MLSAPDRVDVDIPSVKSTENLRRMMQEQQQKQQEQQQHQKQQQQRQQQLPQIQIDRSSNGGHPQPPQLQEPQQQQQQHQLQQKQDETEAASSTPEYTAWTIGSTEMTLTSNKATAAARASILGEGASPPPSALLAKCGLADNNNNNNNNNNNSTLSTSRMSSPDPSMYSVASSPTPPPAPVAPPTLGGLSQNIAMGGTTATTTTSTTGGGMGMQLHSSLLTSPSPSPPPSQSSSSGKQQQSQQQQPKCNKSLQRLYHHRLLNSPTPAVESLLASSCESLNFDIAEMWLRTGPKTHQLTNSHVRPTALDESVRKQLVDVYYGERSAERTHRLSPALCKRAKEAGDVVWVTAHTPHGAEALKCSISDVRTAVAVPVCHVGSGVNVTIIYFSIRR